MNMKFLSQLTKKDISGKICLLRVDLNITKEDLEAIKGRMPLRISAIIPTIKFLTSRGAKVIILSHRGRPEVKNGGYDASEFTLKVFVKLLSRLLRRPVRFAGLDFENLKKAVSRAKPGAVFLVENLRFVAGEEKNDKKFAKEMASWGNFYVNDAFSVSHRANASVAAITNFLPSYMGLLFEKETKNLEKVIKKPKKPFVVILGGAKISDKIGIIKNLYRKADKFLIGGGIANAIFASKGIPVGDSLREVVKLDPVVADGLYKKIFLPVDAVIEDKKILDIGKETAELYARAIRQAKTIIWNGPMGKIEEKKFRKGSEEIMKAIFKGRAFAVVGGGETTSLIKRSKLRNQIFVSTGGGAMLKYFSGKKMPGIAALENNRFKIEK